MPLEFIGSSKPTIGVEIGVLSVNMRRNKPQIMR